MVTYFHTGTEEIYVHTISISTKTEHYLYKTVCDKTRLISANVVFAKLKYRYQN